MRHEDPAVRTAREDLARVDSTDIGQCGPVQLAELLGAMTAATRGLLILIGDDADSQQSGPDGPDPDAPDWAQPDESERRYWQGFTDE